MTVMQLLTSFKFRYFNLLRICHTHTLNTNDNSLLHIYPNDELYVSNALCIQCWMLFYLIINKILTNYELCNIIVILRSSIYKYIVFLLIYQEKHLIYRHLNSLSQIYTSIMMTH